MTSHSPPPSLTPPAAEATVAQHTPKEERVLHRWSRFFGTYTGLAMSMQEAEAVKLQKAQANDHKLWVKCEDQRDSLMQNSPIVRFMLDELEKNGCKFTRKHIQCMECDETRSGGFGPNHGVQLCYNRFLSKAHMEDTLAHELIHAYDYCRFNVDFSNCYHHACTEVRAASLSGDCRFLREINRLQFGLAKQHQVCVKRRAILSLKANPYCSAPGVAEEAVNKVFKSCFNDTRPFDEIY
ncbi:Mitochondrial inner membrane protease atp23 [Dimargaris xerosporica]|nr:Mitochondrial inner membrane protease atp23 [Dimargaris xerosporica]